MHPIGSQCPEIPEDLVEWLVKNNPVRPPTLGQSEREIFWESGRQELITWLRFQLDQQLARAKKE